MLTPLAMRGFIAALDIATQAAKIVTVIVGAGLYVSCAHVGMAQQPVPASLNTEHLFALPLTLEYDGISGLTEDGEGILWAVAETRLLLRIDEHTSQVHHIPIEGLADNIETEAITWISGHRFMVGTEMDTDDRSQDPMILIEVNEGRAFAVERSSCDYGMWGILASSNRGVEGLCRVGDKVVVGTELVQRRGGKRLAPVAIFDMATGDWSAFTVELTTDTGKLSALDCKPAGEGIDVRAIERHFGVSRVIAFHIPADASAQSVRSSVFADFSKGQYASYNLEGLVWRADGSILVVSDNQFRGERQNESRLFKVENVSQP